MPHNPARVDRKPDGMRVQRETSTDSSAAVFAGKEIRARSAAARKDRLLGSGFGCFRCCGRYPHVYLRGWSADAVNTVCQHAIVSTIAI